MKIAIQTLATLAIVAATIGSAVATTATYYDKNGNTLGSSRESSGKTTYYDQNGNTLGYRK